MASHECKALGKAIRRLRIARGWSQQMLADHSGLTRESISAIENGRFDPVFTTLLRIAAALDLKAHELLKGF
jgi:transcriptional regulator with XRE-family HTH domain